MITSSKETEIQFAVLVVLACMFILVVTFFGICTWCGETEEQKRRRREEVKGDVEETADYCCEAICRRYCDTCFDRMCVTCCDTCCDNCCDNCCQNCFDRCCEDDQ